MSYHIRKSDGSLLLTLPDGQLNQTACSTTLIGKNVSNFGEYLNNNFVRLTENFSSSVQPTSPLVGQLWFNKSTNQLMVYTTTHVFADVTASVATKKIINFTQGALGELKLTTEHANAVVVINIEGHYLINVKVQTYAESPIPVGTSIRLILLNWSSVILEKSYAVSLNYKTTSKNQSGALYLMNGPATVVDLLCVATDVWVVSGDVSN